MLRALFCVHALRKGALRPPPQQPNDGGLLPSAPPLLTGLQPGSRQTEKRQKYAREMHVHFKRAPDLMVWFCGWFQIKRPEPSHCLSTILRDLQPFNTRTIEQSPVCRSPFLHTTWLRFYSPHPAFLHIGNISDYGHRIYPKSARLIFTDRTG